MERREKRKEREEGEKRKEREVKREMSSSFFFGGMSPSEQSLLFLVEFSLFIAIKFHREDKKGRRKREKAK